MSEFGTSSNPNPDPDSSPSPSPSSSSSTSSSSLSFPRVTLKKYSVVGLWSRSVEDQESCQICRQLLKEPSMAFFTEYGNGRESVMKNLYGLERATGGICGHTFHADCISKFINGPSSNGKCCIPGCDAMWENVKFEPIGVRDFFLKSAGLDELVINSSGDI